jgi:hypothetical protein
MSEETSILVRLSPEDKRLAETEAAKLGLSVAAFMRLLLKNWTNGITFQKDKANNET